jgi:hypothetical protein
MQGRSSWQTGRHAGSQFSACGQGRGYQAGEAGRQTIRKRQSRKGRVGRQRRT